MALILPEEARETPSGLGLAGGDGRRQRPDPPAAASSTCASPWPMAAARPACACASSPIPPTVDPALPGRRGEARPRSPRASRRIGPSGSRPPTSPIRRCRRGSRRRASRAARRCSRTRRARPRLERVLRTPASVFPAKENRTCPPNQPPSRRPPAPLCRPSAATRRRASSRAPRARWPNSMTEKQLEEFASTKRKGKPEHVGD